MISVRLARPSFHSTLATILGRHRLLHDRPAYGDRMIHVLCRTAVALGRTADADIATLAAIHRQMTGRRVTRAAIRQALDRGADAAGAVRYADLATGLNAEGRDLLFRGAVMVAAAQGASPAADRVLADLARSLAIAPQRVAAIAGDGPLA